MLTKTILVQHLPIGQLFNLDKTLQVKELLTEQQLKVLQVSTLRTLM